MRRSLCCVPLLAIQATAQAWPQALEQQFAERCAHVIASTARPGKYGGTWFENEKRSYGFAMLSILGGHEAPALAFLQDDDAARDWNTHTFGVDYYPCFTLKHQMRKLFHFGDRLDPAYRDRMLRAAKVFTEVDPLMRPHHAFTGATGWGPDAKNSWVDVRSTDNLKLMRETSVYLLAEVSGNEATRQLYAERLTEHVVTMFRCGTGEFDSENYLGHAIAPLLNLHDFAQDRRMRDLARAALDWTATALALHYWRGSHGGPNRRDYNHPYPFGGSAASAGWLWFGDAPLLPTRFESDEVHAITSSYRPPEAVVRLARREFARPVEITSGKPQWAAWQHRDDAAPTFRETMWIGEHFQFGTLVRGTQDPDVNGFKALVRSEVRGADTIVVAPVSDPRRICSPQYEDGLLAGPSAVGQNGPLAIWITKASAQPFTWLVPRSASVETAATVTIVTTEAVTLAIWPLGTEPVRFDAAATAAVADAFADSQVLTAARRGEGFYGFVVEFAERDRDAFARAARERRPEADELATRGAAAMTGVAGRRLRLQWGERTDAIRIWRDGRLRDWDAAAECAIYHTYGDEALVQQAWQGDGTLTVRAGGAIHRVQVDADGAVTFGR